MVEGEVALYVFLAVVGLLLLYVLLSGEREVEWSVEVLQNQLTPSEFEELVKELYESDGYSAELTSDGADGGIDVLASKRGVSAGIEVKRYSDGNTVGSPIVQKAVAAAQQRDQSKAVVVTSFQFTDPAYEVRDAFRSNGAIACELLDGEDVVAQLESHGIPPENWV